MQIVWRPAAQDDLIQIVTYIADRNIKAALDLQTAIETCAERLPDHPFLYRRGRVEGTREAVVHPNYILVYRVGRDVIEVVSVVHARREYP